MYFLRKSLMDFTLTLAKVESFLTQQTGQLDMGQLDILVFLNVQTYMSI